MATFQASRGRRMPATTAAPGSPNPLVKVSAASDRVSHCHQQWSTRTPESGAQERPARTAPADALRRALGIVEEPGHLVSPVVVDDQQTPIRS